MRIGSTVELSAPFKTPGGKSLNKGLKGTVLAVDSQNCMVRFDTLTAWLIVPQAKLTILVR